MRAIPGECTNLQATYFVTPRFIYHFLVVKRHLFRTDFERKNYGSLSCPLVKEAVKKKNEYTPMKYIFEIFKRLGVYFHILNAYYEWLVFNLMSSIFTINNT